MKVYLVRHGEAVSSQFDPQRPLSAQGLADIRKVASFIKPLQISVEHIWHSGKLRAAQTAEILAESMSVIKDCSAHKGLKPNDDVTIITYELVAYSRSPAVSGISDLAVSGRQGDRQRCRIHRRRNRLP